MRNLVSNPELNGANALILDYFSEKDRFSVRRLSLPNAKCNVVPFLVKGDCLHLSSANHFSDKYSNARVEEVSSLNSCLGGMGGTILKLDNLQPLKPLLNVMFGKSHRITGIKVPLSNEGIPSPVTTVCNCV